MQAFQEVGETNPVDLSPVSSGQLDKNLGFVESLVQVDS